MAGEEWTVYAVMAAGILAGSIVKSITGFGSTIAHLCVWSIISALTTKPTGTLQQAVVCELVFRSVTAIPYLWMTNARQTANAKLVVSISLFQTIGSPLGAWLLTVLDQKLLELILAGSLLAVLLIQYLNSWFNSNKEQRLPGEQHAVARKQYGTAGNDGNQEQESDLRMPLLQPAPAEEPEDDNFEKTAEDLQTVKVEAADETQQADAHDHQENSRDVVPALKSVPVEPENIVRAPKPMLFRSRSADLRYTTTDSSYIPPDDVTSLPLLNGHSQSESNGHAELLQSSALIPHAIQSHQWLPPPANGNQSHQNRLAPSGQLPMDRQGCQLHHAANPNKTGKGKCKCTAEDLFWTTPTTACSFLVGGKQQSFHCSICISDSIENADDCEILCSHSYVTSEPEKQSKQSEGTADKSDQRGWVTTLFAGSAAGTLSGVMGGLTGMDGPPTIFMFNAIGATKDTVRGTNAVINCILMTTLLTAYAYLGIFRASDWLLYAVSSVSGMLGTVWGDHISSYMDQSSFASMLNVMVLACALLEGASGLGFM